MKNIKAVLFDFDGTIFDTNKLIIDSWNEVFRIKGGSRTEEEILATFGEPLTVSMEKWFPGESEECINIYRNYQRDIFFEKIELYEGMDELIKKLKTLGVLNAVVTSRLASSTISTLEKYDLARYFDVIVTANQISRSKPDPECYLLAAKLLDADIQNCYVFEDSLAGLAAGRAAGMTVVGLSTTLPFSRIEDKADIVISDFREFDFDKLMSIKRS